MFHRLVELSRAAIVRMGGHDHGASIEHRRDGRWRTTIFGTAMCGGHLTQVRILDLSRTGAKIALSEGETIRDLVWLHGPRLDRLGRVMWSNDGEAGVKFSPALTKAEFESVLGRSLEHPNRLPQRGPIASAH